MSVELYITYVLACIVLAIIPGPMVTLIIANSLTHGTRAGLLNAAGAQAGVGLYVATVAVGLASIIAAMGWWFDWLRLAGAAYLVWLGWKLLRASGAIEQYGRMPVPRGGFFLQGFLVLLGNPKALLFFGAFVPQFIDPRGDFIMQVVVLGLTFMAVAAATDAAYAVMTGRARTLLSRQRVRAASVFGGLCLVAGGVWLAFARAR